MSRWDRVAPKKRDDDESDEYLIVEAILVARTSGAIKVATKQGDWWIPRSCLHGADDIKAGVALLGYNFVFRLRAWKCEEIGLA